MKRTPGLGSPFRFGWRFLNRCPKLLNTTKKTKNLPVSNKRGEDDYITKDYSLLNQVENLK